MVPGRFANLAETSAEDQAGPNPPWVRCNRQKTRRLDAKRKKMPAPTPTQRVVLLVDADITRLRITWQWSLKGTFYPKSSYGLKTC